MKKITTILLFFMVIILSAQLFAEENKKVFILASYEKDHVCGWPQEEGVLKGLNKEGWFEGLNLEVTRYYMDTKKKNTTPELMKKQAEIALELIEKVHPDIIVTIDDNAFREVGLKYVNHPTIQVVFSGMNGQPENYNEKVEFLNTRSHPGHNVTGVYEKLYVVRSLKVLSSAIGSQKKTKVIGITDYSPTGKAIAKQFEIELKDLPSNIEWELRKVKDWNEYTGLIGKINKDSSVDAIYPVALSLKVSDNLTYSAPEIFKWTIKNSKKPELALNYFFSKVGLFGGAAVDFKSMGFMAGKKAGMILNGKPTGELSIEDAPDYAIVFNQKRAKQLGINIPVPLLTAADHIYE